MHVATENNREISSSTLEMKEGGSTETSTNSYQITSKSTGVFSHFKNRVTAALSGGDAFKFLINRTTVRRTLVFCEHLRSKLLTHWHTQPAVRRAEPSMPLLLILALCQ
jgi:hypothetical protein